jgi:hypothetical protein
MDQRLLIAAIANLGCLATTMLLIFYKFRPHPSWCQQLRVAWVAVVLIGLSALAWLIYGSYLASEYDRWGSIDKIVMLIGLGPMAVAGLIALFFKPK